TANYKGAFSNMQVQAVALDPTIPPVSPPPTCTISISPATIFAGGSATLSWASSVGATSISFDNGIGNVSPVSSGTKTVSPLVSTTYTAVVSGSGGSNNCNPQSVSIVVQPPPNCADTLMVLDRTGSIDPS